MTHMYHGEVNRKRRASQSPSQRATDAPMKKPRSADSNNAALRHRQAMRARAKMLRDGGELDPGGERRVPSYKRSKKRVSVHSVNLPPEGENE